MSETADFIASVLDAEFDGKSWNGPSLMATLEKLDHERAASDATFEGYTAWSIGIHCAKCAYVVAGDLGATLPPWRFAAEGWFPAPAAVGPDAWRSDLAYFREIHEKCSSAIRAMDGRLLAEPMPTWKAPWLDVFRWLVTHDAFHAAQIRSMGLPELREAAHS